MSLNQNYRSSACYENQPELSAKPTLRILVQTFRGGGTRREAIIGKIEHALACFKAATNKPSRVWFALEIAYWAICLGQEASLTYLERRAQGI